MPAEKIPSNAFGNGGVSMGKNNCHSAIAFSQISRYLADASTYLGVVATVAGQMV
jgi:hypothetical protein